MITHCWEGLREYLLELGHAMHSDDVVETFISGDMTCMRETHGDNNHEWTPDGEIRITFVVQKQP